MKSARWVCLILLTLLLIVGTTHCAGPRSREVKPTAEQTIPKEPAKEIAEQSREAPKDVSPGASKESPQLVPAEPPRPVFPPVMPSAPPGPAPLPMVSSPTGSLPIGPPSPGAPAPGLKPPEAGKNSRFVLNFDNADIFEVIRVMAEMMSINYIVDPRIKGVVNIRTSGQISTKDIFPIFQAILKMNGAAAVQKGIIYEIVPFGDAKKLYSVPTV